jgi:ribonuclease HII
MKPKRIIIGIDEVGRGALAGPVVASAVAIEQLIDGVKDSKLLNVKQREKLAGEIEKHAIALSIEMIPPQEIDKLNIYNATLLAMKNALFMTLEDLKPSPIQKFSSSLTETQSFKLHQRKELTSQQHDFT